MLGGSESRELKIAMIALQKDPCASQFVSAETIAFPHIQHTSNPGQLRNIHPKRFDRIQIKLNVL